MLNRQVSSWRTGVNAGVPQDSILGPFLIFFLVYINDLADRLSLNAKYFADDTSLFLVIHDVDTSVNKLNNDLYQINKWAFQWKIALTQTQPNRSKKLVLVKKLRNFIILRYVLTRVLSRKRYTKNSLAYFLMLN